jgi:hypothetical protein
MMAPEFISAKPFPGVVAPAPRCNLATVRNWMLALPEVQDLATLPPEARVALRRALLAVSEACRAKGNEAWRKHKPPMAAYWKGNAVHAKHLARAIPKGMATTAPGHTEAPYTEPMPSASHPLAGVIYTAAAKPTGCRTFGAPKGSQ